MARQNLCPNPACGANATGWVGQASAPTRQAVTGFGRPYAARTTDGTYTSSPWAIVVPNTTYTFSCYVRASRDYADVFFINWFDSDGNFRGSEPGEFSLTTDTVTRLTLTGISHSDAGLADFTVERTNYNLTLDQTMLLMEQGSELLDYFDGESPGASWDGAQYNSTSTLAPAGSPPLIGWGSPLT